MSVVVAYSNCAIPNPLAPKNSRRNLHPDLLLFHDGEYYIWEVKPASQTLARTAERQVRKYVLAIDLDRKDDVARPGQYLPELAAVGPKSTLLVASPPEWYNGATGARYYNVVSNDEEKRYIASNVRVAAAPGVQHEAAQDPAGFRWIGQGDPSTPHPVAEDFYNATLPLKIGAPWEIASPADLLISSLIVAAPVAFAEAPEVLPLVAGAAAGGGGAAAGAEVLTLTGGVATIVSEGLEAAA